MADPRPTNNRLGRRQFYAVMKKNFLLKIRRPVMLAIELLSPLLFLSFIVYFFQIVPWKTEPIRIYANESFPFFNASTLLGSALFNADDLDPADFAQELVGLIESYAGPTPIFSVDEFVWLHEVLVASAGEENLPLVDRAQTFIFNDKYGNLVRLGKVYLSPSGNPGVRDYNQFMLDNYNKWPDIYGGMYVNEEEAVNAALRAETSAMAVIHFNELNPDLGIFNISLRMNHTTLPSTEADDVFKYLPRGLWDKYQRYIWSGFLTLQNSVSLWARETSPRSEIPSVEDVFRGIVIGQLDDNQDPFEIFPRADDVTIPRETFWDVVNGLAKRGRNGINSTEVADRYDAFPDDFPLDGLAEFAPDLSVIPDFPRSSGFGDTIILPFPTLAHDNSIFFERFGWLSGLIITASIVLPVSRLIAVIVEEKEIRIKEMLKQMGLRDWAFSSSWIISYMLIFFVLSLLEIGTMFIGQIYSSSSFSLVLSFFYLFMVSQIAFCFFLSTFFNRAKLACIVGPVCMLCLTMPAYVFSFYPPHQFIETKQWLCLLAPSAFAFGIDRISIYEEARVGVQWDNYSDGRLNLQFVMRMLMLDFVLYIAFAWYLDKVLPSKYGQHQKWNFIFSTGFWGRFWKSSSEVTKAKDNGHAVAAGWAMDKPSVKIDGLYKVFNSTRKGNKVAIAGLNLQMFHDEITCLLGTNGAGKTTTISILTGTTNASGGDCSIYGNSVNDEMHAIRRFLGICPQYDVLFNDLTVREHLQKTVDTMIAEVELCDKEHFASSCLSGGQKRKLSVGMALVGGSKVVFLDEPTSGMDPQARRSTWELLLRARKGRTSILTTHYLDEADLLGDRIAIMKDGRLCACGSSLELKNQYGMGYILTLVIDPLVASPEDINNLVSAYVRENRLLSSSGSEMGFQLPLQAIGAFPAMFEQLEQNSTALGVNSYGISMTTLEEVFLTIARGAEGVQAKTMQDILSASNTPNNFSPPHQKPVPSGPPAQTGPPQADLFPRNGPTEQPPSEGTWPPKEADNGLANGDGFEEALGRFGTASEQFGRHAKKTLPPIQNSTGPPRQLPPLQNAQLPPIATNLSLSRDVPSSVDNFSASPSNKFAGTMEMQPQSNGWEVKAKEKSSWRQFWEMIRKRHILSLRDPSGMFQERVMPVIVCVFAMSILSIRPEISGPSMYMDGVSLFGDQETGQHNLDTLVCNQQPLFDMGMAISSSRPGLSPASSIYGYVEHTPAQTSIEVSYQLLEDWYNHKDTIRMASLVYEDTVYQRINLGEIVGREVETSEILRDNLAGELKLDPVEFEDMSLNSLFFYVFEDEIDDLQFDAVCGRLSDCDVGDTLYALSENFTLFNESSPFSAVNEWGRMGLQAWSESPRVRSYVLERSEDGGSWVVSKLPEIALFLGNQAANEIKTEDVLQGLGQGTSTGISYFRTENTDDINSFNSTDGSSAGGDGSSSDSNVEAVAGGAVQIVEISDEAIYTFSDLFPTVQSVILALGDFEGQNLDDITLLDLAENSLESAYETSHEGLIANNLTSCRDDVLVDDLLDVEGFEEDLSEFRNDRNETLEEYLENLESLGDSAAQPNPGDAGDTKSDPSLPSSAMNTTTAVVFLDENRNLTICEFFEKYNESATDAFADFQNAEYDISFGDVVDTVYFGRVVGGGVPGVGTGGITPNANSPDAPNIGGAELPAIPGIENAQAEGNAEDGESSTTLGDVWYWLGDRADDAPTPDTSSGVPFVLSLDDVQDFATADTSDTPINEASSTGALLRSTQETLIRELDDTWALTSDVLDGPTSAALDNVTIADLIAESGLFVADLADDQSVDDLLVATGIVIDGVVIGGGIVMDELPSNSTAGDLIDFAGLDSDNFLTDLGDLTEPPLWLFVNELDIGFFLGSKSANVSFPTKVTALHNSTHRGHSTPAFLAHSTQAELRVLHSSEEAKFVLYNHPLPPSQFEDLFQRAWFAFFAILFTIIPLCYVPACYAMFVVQEKQWNAKHLGLVNGLYLPVYWVSSFVWDMIWFLFVSVWIIVIFSLTGAIDWDTSRTNVGQGVFVLFVMYGVAVILCSYCLSFLFSQGSDAQLFITVIHFISGWIFMIISFIMEGTENLKETNELLESYLWRLFPTYNLAEGLAEVTYRSILGQLLGTEIDVFEWDILGRNYVALAYMSVAYALLLSLLEAFRASRFLGIWNNLALMVSKNQILPKQKRDQRTSANMAGGKSTALPGPLRYVEQELEMTALGPTVADIDPGEVSIRIADSLREKPAVDPSTVEKAADPFTYDEDVDVATERKHVVESHQSGSDSNALRIIGLRKIYPGSNRGKPKVAVRSLSLGVRKGECFGFLGTNGAGKTTTLKMLTGDVTPTEGAAFVKDISMITQLRQAQHLIGYCPQFDALYPRMTAREHLHMYARIKGIEEHMVPIVTEQLLQTVTLEKFADKPSGTYSGGNKRKLSLCIALMGNPSLVLLDEPSSGMDPHARRAMWDVISSSMGDGRSVMLTTHSMEECEALCSRVGIMVTGALRCLGTPQHLKNRFGEGYQIEMRVTPGSDTMAVQYITRNFGAKVMEVHGCRIRARMKMRRELSLSKIFAEMEKRKEALGILNYSISQSSLEQVFMKIANEHNEFQRNTDTEDVEDEIDPIGDGSL